jgi:hypothetical protein
MGWQKATRAAHAVTVNLTLVLDKLEHGGADLMRKVDAEEVLQQLWEGRAER